MARWATLGILTVFVIGVIVGISSSGNATAQDTDSAKIEALGTRVANLEGSLSFLYSASLPGPDPNGQWIGNAYSYDRAYQFDLLCTINPIRSDWLLGCTRPQPMNP